ncbi:unnamed protein product [Withania somnifera]
MELGTCFNGANVNQKMFLSDPITQKSIHFPSSWLNPLNFSFPAKRICSCRAIAKGSTISSLKTQEKVTRMSSNHSQDLELSSLSALYVHWTVVIWIKWLIKMSRIPQIVEVPSFSEGAHMDDALEVKKIERVTNHDVKAVEFFLKQRCQSHLQISKVLEFFHFACTSKDINNLAHALMLKGALNTVILPVMDELIKAICEHGHNKFFCSHAFSHPWTFFPTPASQTTLGKEMAVFAYRLSRERREISQIEMLGKFAVAVGNYNAHVAAYPEINWPEIAEEFVISLGLKFNPYVPEIETHDYMAKLFHSIVQFNNILTTKAGEIGSSTMPQKVNSIDFENSEGNLGVAIGDLSHLSTKPPISRWQRDLTDSTVLRNMGVGLGHSLLAYKSALQGIKKLQVNEAVLMEDLDKTWEVLDEPIQMEMRRYGVPVPYEKLKELTRGRAVIKESIREFIQNMEIPVDAKISLLNLTPHTYFGTAADLAKNVNEAINLLNGGHI